MIAMMLAADRATVDKDHCCSAAHPDLEPKLKVTDWLIEDRLHELGLWNALFDLLFDAVPHALDTGVTFLMTTYIITNIT